MLNFFQNKIKNSLLLSLKSIFKKEFWLLIFFEENQLALQSCVFSENRIRLGKRWVFKNVSGDNFSGNYLLKFLGRFIFFPFRFSVGVIVPMDFCSSRYFTLEHQINFQSVKEEIIASFSQSILKVLADHKKELALNKKVDDFNLILTNNQTMVFRLNGKFALFPSNFVMSENQSISKKVSLGFTQTLVLRSFFNDLTKIFSSKRIRLKYFFESSFALALSNLLSLFYHQSKDISKKILFVFIEERATYFYVFDGQSLRHCDSFGFGEKNFFDAFHRKTGISYPVFEKILSLVVEGRVSHNFYRVVRKILDDEIFRLIYGIHSIGMSVGAKKIFLWTSNFKSSFLLTKKFLEKLLFPSNFFSFSNVIEDLNNQDCPNNLKAILALIYECNKKSLFNTMVNRQIRWLIPYNIHID